MIELVIVMCFKKNSGENKINITTFKLRNNKKNKLHSESLLTRTATTTTRTTTTTTLY